MSEELFWIIYFTLVKTLLPPEAFAKEVAAEVAAESGGAAPLPGGFGAASGSSKSLRVGAGSRRQLPGCLLPVGFP